MPTSTRKCASCRCSCACATARQCCEPLPVSGTPLYTDVRLYGAAGVPAAIYGAGPRTVLESNAKRADEHLVIEDLRRATKVIARTVADLLA
jgi:succinyl-diaminopimelate desuccinylase